MHFLLKKNFDGLNQQIDISDNYPLDAGKNFLWYSKSKLLTAPNDDQRFIIVLGDLISENHIISFETLYDKIVHRTLYEYGGFFYVLFIDNRANKIKIFNSAFGILPIYYTQKDNSVLISSSIEKIIQSAGKTFKVDKQYLLERLLLNYGFSDRTYFNELKLVPANHCAVIENKLYFEKVFEVTDLFSPSPQKGKSALVKASESFIHNSQKYFGEEKFAQSFTGGFDGRTLLSAAKYFNKDFFAYSFGTERSKDLLLPLAQSKMLGIEFQPVLLNDEYVTDHSYNCGIDLINLTDGNAAFARAHYVYAARTLSEKVNYIITGNFGSELLRAVHNAGVVISKELMEYFGFNNNLQWIGSIKNSNKLKYLNENNFKNTLDSLIQELFEYKSNLKPLSKNEAFYVYILNEVFRKYFGAEIVMQSKYLKNRSPYLDFNFIKELFNTYYAGVYSDYFTDNPINRYKGQLLYAEIIKKTYPALLEFKTIRGYAPKSLLSNTGKAALVINQVKKKFKVGEKADTDSFAVSKAYAHNLNYWSRIKIAEEYYNKNYLIDIIKKPSADIDLVINVLSINHYLIS